MGDSLKNKVREILRTKKMHKKWVYSCISLSLIVVLIINSGLAMQSIAMSKDSGHTHTEDCYEEERVLICGQEESEGHVHSEDCYTKVKGELICGQEESEEHTHTDECYEWHDELTCDMEEGEGAHHHTDECYQVNQVLTCGLEESAPVEYAGMGLEESEETSSEAETEENTDAETVEGSSDTEGEASNNEENAGEEATGEENAEGTDPEADPAAAAEGTIVPAEETKTEEVNMPAVRFEEKTQDIVVIVEAEEGTFPEGTTMIVEQLEDDDEEVNQAVTDVIDKEKAEENIDANEEVKVVKAVDITFRNAKGEEIEPLLPVRVTMTSDTIKESENVVIVHLDDEDQEKNEVIKQKEEKELEQLEIEPAEDQVVFEAEKFSKYVIVGTETITTDFLSADGNTYHIEVTLDERDAIGGTAELSVEEIEEGSDSYINYLAYAAESMMLESTDDIRHARFFDVTILRNGEKYEPVYPAKVTITYDNAIEIAEDEALKAIHFANSGTEIIEEVEITENGTTVSYEQTGFSVTGTVVTNANNIESGQQYVIYTQSGGNYYAISHTSEGRDQDIVYPVRLDQGSTTNGNTISVQNAGSDIVWTVTKVGDNYRFSYESGGNTYYLRTYGGLMVGKDSDYTGPDDGDYPNTNRYTWTYDNQRHLRTLSNKNRNDRYLSYSNNVIKERANGISQFYFARVTNVTDINPTPTIHYVDESGNELTVVNGRDWTADPTTSPAFLIYDIDGYEYVKTTLTSVDGTQIRPIIRQRAQWQYTTDTQNNASITWTDIPVDTEDSTRLEDIYVVYKKATEPVSGGTPKIKPSSSTEDPIQPSIHKTSTSNGDGTNTIGLSITSDTSPLEVEKLADVIVIFDVSTSMRREMNNGTQHNDDNTAAVNCNHSTRLWIAHNAVKNLANTLIGPNTEFKDSDRNKLIRMSLISFSDEATQVQGFTEDYDAYASAVEGLRTHAGTNWEDALRMANNMAVDSERATFVIFVTDGNPSYRATRGNALTLEGYPDTVSDSNVDIYGNNSYYMYRANSIFGALDENDVRNYNTALDVAKSIVDHNKNYYAIGVGPTSGVTRLQGLTTYAYGGDSTKGADRTKNATDSDELARAFNEITASIVALLGWGDITMTDGITSLSNTVEKSGLVDVDGNFEYWKAEAPEAWSTWSKNIRSGYTLGTSGADLSYPDDYNTWSQADKDGYVAAYNQGKNLTDSDFASWNPATENCDEAVYDDASGSVKWDMGHNFVPESGCTYRVTFKVWPSQEAYDILAKCKNDPTYYNTLSDAQKAQIIKSGNTYTLKTNDKNPNTTYKAARKTGDGVTTSGDESTLFFNDVPNLDLSENTISVKKEWENALDDGRTPYPVKLGVQAIGTDNPDTADDESLFAIIDVSEDTQWMGSAYISTGLMKVENGNQTIYEHGHDFTITEDIPGGPSYHWELTADTYRPMVITDSSKGYSTPTTVMLKKVTASESYDYVIDGGYYKIQSGAATLTATNTRRSNLNLVKQVINSEGTPISSAQLFEFTVTVDDPTITPETASDSDIWFSVQTDPSDESTIVKDLEVEGATAETKDGAHTGFFYLRDNSSFKVKIQPGWNLRVTNLPSGTTYTITETAQTGYTFESATVDNDGTFVVTENTTTGNGVIDEANKQYTVTYTNRTITKNVSIWKTDMDHTAITVGATFALYSAEDYDDTAGKPKAGALPIMSGTTGTNGILTLGALPIGEYRLVETNAPAGYNLADSAIRITVSANDVTAMQGTGVSEVAQDIEGNPYRQYYVAGQEEGTYQIRVWNNPGVELPNTGGPGTLLYTLSGIALMLGAALMYGFRMRRRERRLN